MAVDMEGALSFKMNNLYPDLETLYEDDSLSSFYNFYAFFVVETL
jgi:hypothetical protein